MEHYHHDIRKFMQGHAISLHSNREYHGEIWMYKVYVNPNNKFDAFLNKAFYF